MQRICLSRTYTLIRHVVDLFHLSHCYRVRTGSRARSLKAPASLRSGPVSCPINKRHNHHEALRALRIAAAAAPCSPSTYLSLYCTYFSFLLAGNSCAFGAKRVYIEKLRDGFAVFYRLFEGQPRGAAAK